MQTLAQKKKNSQHTSKRYLLLQYQRSDHSGRSTDKRHFFIVLRGVVNIVKNTSEVTIAKLKGGAIFGEISYISKRSRITSAIAGGDVIALKIDSKKIDALNPAVSTKLKNKFIEVLVDRLEAMNKLVNLNI